MRIKKKWVVLCLIAFMGLIVWRSYLSDYIYEDCSDSSSDSLSPACNFDKRLKSLEKQISSNNDALSAIENVIKEMENVIQLNHSDQNNINKLMMKIENVKQMLDDSNGNENQNDNLIFSSSSQNRARLPASFCSADSLKEASSDLDMFDIHQSLKFDNPDGGVWKQGFPITVQSNLWNNKDKKLEVFVVPHSHQDPGWIMTFDDYYKTQSSSCLNSMLDFLINNPKMRFVYAEIAFFHRWFESISSEKQKLVKKLLDSKQLEIVSGGWVMTDEANAHYYATIEEMTEGHQWLEKNLNYKPEVSWSIDPFGHSSTMPYLWNKIGFKYMVISRTHYAIKKHLALNKSLEFIWRQRWDSSGRHDMFCHMLPFYAYDVPHTCGPDPSVCCQFDFHRMSCPWKKSPVEITEVNVKERAEMLLDQYRKKSTLYHNNVVLIPLGDDFRYLQTSEWLKQYTNYQRLFDHLNSHENEYHVNVKFATLSEYFQAIATRAGSEASLSPSSPILPKGYPSFMGDMFTYADRDAHYWSGYFTSRPYHKRLDRYLIDKLRQAEVLFSLTHAISNRLSIKMDRNEYYTQLSHARRQLSLFQHHDGITGTAKASVVNDYEDRLTKALEGCGKVIEYCVSWLASVNNVKQRGNIVSPMKLIDISENAAEFEKQHFHQVKISQSSSADQSSEIIEKIYIFNSLANVRHDVVSIRIDYAHIQIRGPGNEIIPFELTPFHFASEILSDILTNDFALRFYVEIPPLTMQMFTIHKLNKNTVKSKYFASLEFYHIEPQPPLSQESSLFQLYKPKKTQDENIFQLENDYFIIHFDKKSGYMKSIHNKASTQTVNLNLEFHSYSSEQSSHGGAYLFIPNGKSKVLHEENPSIRISHGTVFDEVIVIYSFIEHHVRLYHANKNIAIEIVNYVNILSNAQDFELVMQLTSKIENNQNHFYTDQNCLQMNLRETLDKLPIQGNVYPMACAAYLEDESSRITVLSAQPQGVYLPTAGILQLWLDRRLHFDDDRGLGEGVLDNRAWTPDRFIILHEALQSPKIQGPPSRQGQLTATAQVHLRSLLHPLQSWHVTGLQQSTSSSLSSNINFMTGTGLPCDVSLVNLRTSLVNDDYSTVIILRREVPHCGSPWLIGVDCTFSVNGSVTFKSLFNDLVIDRVERVSLTQTHTLETISEKALHIMPMELEAFRLYFRELP